MLKPQDIVVGLKVQVSRGEDWTYRSLAEELSMSHSEVHDALKRAGEAGIYSPDSRSLLADPFLSMLPGLRYIFYVRPGRLVRGMPTAHSGPPLKDEFHADGEDVYVWPDPEGEIRGQAIEPLYSSVPKAAKNDSDLYEWLNLVEAVRVGRPREQAVVRKMFEDRLKESQVTEIP